MENREQLIVAFLSDSPQSSKSIFDNLALGISYATLKRVLSKLVHANVIQINGRGKGTKYQISPSYHIHVSIDMDAYYKKEIDERKIKERFNPLVVKEILYQAQLFKEDELKHLSSLQDQYQNNIRKLKVNEYQKELERLAIDLSWKSSQIEGNTYSLLETEKLLKEKETAAGKTKEEAIMLLNHKDALDFVIEHPDYLDPLTVSKIEDIHSILVKELEIDRNLRTRRIGISGTNYRPLDNEFLIRDALKDMCDLINSKANIFEKALLVLVLISYVQPFMDGNKRTARIMSNAILMNNEYCPISFRTVDSLEYKKAMLLFYEQNNIYNFKKIFIDQFEFAVKTYF